MNIHLILPLVQTFCCLILAALVLRGHFRDLTHRLFSMFLIGLAIWGIIIFGMRISTDIQRAYSWDRWLIPLTPFISVLFYHFSTRYTDMRIRSWILPILYAICLVLIPLIATDLVFSGMQEKPYGYAPTFGPVWPFWILFSLALSIMSFVNFGKSWRRSVYAEQRNRAAYALIGIIIFWVGGASDIFPVFGLPLYPGFIICNIAFCILITVAIVKHNLLDIHIVFRKGAAYFIATGLIALIFVGIFLSVTNISTDRQFLWWASLTLLILLALALPMSWRWIQQQVDRWFFGERYSYLKALDSFRRDSQSISDSTGLATRAVKLLSGAFGTPTIHLLEPVKPNGDFHTVVSTDTSEPSQTVRLSSKSPLVKWLKQSDGIITYGDIELTPQLQAVNDREKENIQRIKAELIVPLKTRNNELPGILILGRKLSDQTYTLEDRQLVSSLSSQLAIKLESARLYEEATQTRQELKVLSRRLVEIQEDERRAIARELHDEISQSLMMANFLLERSMKSRVENASDSLGEVQAMIKEAIRQVREMSLNLRPSIIDDLGLLPALHWYLEQYTARTNVRVNFKHGGLKTDLPTNTRTATYRIVQEALNNVARHANVNAASVNIWARTGILHIQVEDAGSGFDYSKIAVTSSGISGMRERALMLGGRFTIDTAPGRGTSLKVELPILEGKDNDGNNIAGG